MELTGNDAERWEQMSNEIQEIEEKIASYYELVKGMGSTLMELATNLGETQQIVNNLSNLAYKEVLRQESGTINADDDYGVSPSALSTSINAMSELPQTKTSAQSVKPIPEPATQSQVKSKTKASPKRKRRTTKTKTLAVDQAALLGDEE